MFLYLIMNVGIFSALTFHEKTELLSMMAECCHLLAAVPDSHEKKLTKCIFFSWLAIKIVKNKNRAFVFERKMRRTHEMYPLQKFRWRLPIAHNGGQFSLTNKEFKEFYWNKDKFQSQSLIFQKKKKRNMLWVLALTFHDFSPKPSLLIQRLVHVRKIIINPTRQVILAQSSLTSTLLCWHIVTSVLWALCVYWWTYWQSILL